MLITRSIPWIGERPLNYFQPGHYGYVVNVCFRDDLYLAPSRPHHCIRPYNKVVKFPRRSLGMPIRQWQQIGMANLASLWKFNLIFTSVFTKQKEVL